MVRPSRSVSRRPQFLPLLLLFCGLAVDVSTASAQRNRRSDDVDPEILERRIQAAEESLVREFIAVTKELSDQGENEKALEMLRRLQEISPKVPGIQDEIQRISEEIMQANQLDFELDVSKGWGSAVADVAEGRAFRIQADGEFRLTWEVSLTPEGARFAQAAEKPGRSRGDGGNRRGENNDEDDSPKDFLPGAPIGSLIGVVVTNGKPGRPFSIGTSAEHTPRESGQLFLRVNAPPMSRVTGSLKIRMSGNLRSLIPPRRRLSAP